MAVSMPCARPLIAPGVVKLLGEIWGHLLPSLQDANGGVALLSA